MSSMICFRRMYEIYNFGGKGADGEQCCVRFRGASKNGVNSIEGGGLE